nr:RAMP superfamily CRISPR-associated protein [Methanocaldococcus fervens]
MCGGVIYEISEDDLKALDRQEGYPITYGRKEITVFCVNKNIEIKAYVYFREGEPIENLQKNTLTCVKDAKEHGIPEDYIKNVLMGGSMTNNNFVNEINVYAVATDPIYIGTGGYTIGRVDNTIVRDPITKIPKIPGSSLAGTWRYYVALKLQGYFKDDYRVDKSKRKEKKIEELFELENNEDKDWVLFEGNRYAGIKCAGQDDLPNIDYESAKDEKTGHCGRCIVCKAFGFSKKDVSWQGLIYFSDLNILFFPVYTRFGVKWITSKRILKEAGLLNGDFDEEKNVVFALKEIEKEIEDDKKKGHINLGWLYLPYKVDGIKINLGKIQNFGIDENDIIIVPDNLISQIINSNLEVRTSVSIDPITGTAKEGALFTSEAIPRGTIFYGKIRIFDKKPFEEINDNKTNKLKPLPTIKQIKDALEDSKIFFETLGIGGMTTRGFGRLKIELFDENGKKFE